ncbi:origin recognition complex subunit 3 isoform X2 [Rhinatrema bivittatum]|uniref:origin recognition complex subunit 3 isoform X2 n=1 Tax=Rhinatrema bivittatum TaxID=194408 RepID=UPI00112ECBFD|nr:origin recognition complex subunit 3 isoform X2 [Rhinatrema bivittatum]
MSAAGGCTSSVSKGCFVFKPSSKKRKSSLTTADYFNADLKDLEDGQVRFDTCQSLWQEVKLETEQLQEELNKKLFDSLIEFLRKSHSEFQGEKNEWSCRTRSSEIPTAALVLGVNVTDHDGTFKSLSEVLWERVTPYVASLQAKECPGIKQLLQKLLAQLMGQLADVDLNSDEEEEHVQTSQRRRGRPMASLCSWYRSVTKRTSQSKKRTSSSSWHLLTPPVVVILKDLERFAPKVLQDFIVISSLYTGELPLIFVFGIATSPMIIHRLLSHSVSSLLCIELFQSVSCTQHLAAIVDKLLLTTRFPLRLSGKVLLVLTNIFLYHDFSVQNFIKGLQLSVVEHFHSQPLSMLCCHLPEAKKRLRSLLHEQCENIRQLPSFMSYVDTQTSEHQVKLLTSDSFLKDVAQTLLEDLHAYHKNYIPVLKCLHEFTCLLPKYPLGRQVRELHCACMEKKVWESEEYTSAFQLLRMLAKDELVATLRKCVEILKSSACKELSKALKKLEEFLSRFHNLEGSVSAEEHEYLKDENMSPPKVLQKKTDLYHLQKTLLELKESRRSKKLTNFEVLRLEVVEFLDSLVRDYLVPPETKALYEVMYFSDASTLRRHLNAAPRTALHMALNNPYCYLKNEALKNNDGVISNLAPDICIAYKLHLECGRLINLYDWLEAFTTVVTTAEGADSASVASGRVDEVIHARFIKAVSELELLGFIKATKLKTDHVARLTWGGC